ncbi:hypothetical protein HZ326_28450, partial [Fusarium oxysporum f. sp. albedinis]
MTKHSASTPFLHATTSGIRQLKP